MSTPRAGMLWVTMAALVAFVSLNAGQACAQKNVSIGGLFPMTGRLASRGPQRASAARVAIEDANNNTNLLPGHTLKMVIKDTQTLPTGGFKAAFEAIDSGGVVGLVGAASSSVSEAVAFVASVFGLPQVSYSSTSASLSNKALFPNFMRVVPPDNQQGLAMAQYNVTVDVSGALSSMNTAAGGIAGGTRILFLGNIPFSTDSPPALLYSDTSFSLQVFAPLDVSLLLGSLESVNFTVTLRDLSSSPTLGLDCLVALNLQPLNPSQWAVRILGSIGGGQGYSLTASGLVPAWSRPFNVSWLSIDPLAFYLSLRPGTYNATFSTTATLTLPGINPYSSSVWAQLVDGDLSVSGSGLSIGRITTLMQDLLAAQVPSLDLNFSLPSNFAAADWVISGAQRARFELPGSLTTGFPVGRGLTIITPVDAGALLDDMGVLFNRSFVFNFGATIPVFDFVDVTQFKDTFQVFLRTNGFNLNAEVFFEGLAVVSEPFATPATVALEMSAVVDLSASKASQQPLTFYLAGQVSLAGEVLLAGSMSGFWEEPFGLRNLSIGNAGFEVGVSPGPVLTTFGVSCEILFGQTRACFAGRISANFLDSFVLAQVTNLNLGELFEFAASVNPDLTNIVNGVGVISQAVTFNTLSLTLAPKSGTFAGFTYKQGIEVDCDATIFGINVVAYFALLDVDLVNGHLVAPGQLITQNNIFKDFQFAFSINTGTVFDALDDVIAVLFGGTFKALEAVLGPLGVSPPKISDVFSVDLVGIDNLSIYNVSRGILPDLVIQFTVFGVQDELRISVDFDVLGASLRDLFLGDTQVENEVGQCLTSANCADPLAPMCDTTVSPYVCAANSTCVAPNVITQYGCFPPAPAREVAERSHVLEPREVAARKDMERNAPSYQRRAAHAALYAAQHSQRAQLCLAS